MPAHDVCAPVCRPLGFPARRRQEGFSLVELMIGLVISLLVGLAAVGSAQTFMIAQRQSVNSGSALSDAVAASDTLKYEASQAGLGLVVPNMNCTGLNLSAAGTTLSAAASFFPVNIKVDAKAQTTLTVAYGTALEAANPAFINADSDGSSAELTGFLPISAGQTILLAPADSPGPCTVKTASRVVPASGVQGQQIFFDAGGLHNAVVFSPGVTYPAGSQMLLLGQFRLTKFSVNTGNLVMERPLESSKAVILARDVVGFTAQYGMTDGVNPSLSSWSYAEGALATLSVATSPNIRALRIGLVVRGAQREKPSSTGACSATTTQPLLLDRSLALTGDWQCYKYRAISVVVPVRNLMMGGSA